MKRVVVIYIDSENDDDDVVEEATCKLARGEYEVAPGWTLDALVAARVAVKRRMAVRELSLRHKRSLHAAYAMLAATEKALTGLTPSTRAEP